MGTFRVDGSHRATGYDASFTVEAADAIGAEHIANERGFVEASVRPEAGTTVSPGSAGPMQPPSPSQPTRALAAGRSGSRRVFAVYLSRTLLQVLWWVSVVVGVLLAASGVFAMVGRSIGGTELRGGGITAAIVTVASAVFFVVVMRIALEVVAVLFDILNELERRA